MSAQVGVADIHPTLPYITNGMFRHAATGIAPDMIVAGGTPQQQEAELARQILKASAEMDLFCYGASGGVLRATVDTEMLRLRMDTRRGVFNLTPRFTPVLALNSFSSGDDPAAMAALTDLTHVEIETARIRVPAYPFTGMTSAGPLQFGVRVGGDWEWLVQFSYVNGWPLTSLTAGAATGAQTITVDDATGIYANRTRLTVRDPVTGDDSFIVSAVNGNVLTIPALTHDHAVGAQVDGLTQALVDACVEITTGMLKRRSQQAVKVLRRTSTNANTAKGGGYLAPQSPGLDNFERGFGLLERFVQVRTR